MAEKNDNIEAVLNAGITKPGIDHKHVVGKAASVKSPPKKRGRPAKQVTPRQKSTGRVPVKLEQSFRKDMKSKLLGEHEDLDKASTIRKIQGFYEFFPEIPVNGGISAKSSKEDLAVELDRVRKFRRRGQALNNIKRADLLLTYAAEFGLLAAGYEEVRGLTVVAQSSQEVISDVLTELAIEYEDQLSSGPWALYMLHFVERVTKTVEMNKRAHNIQMNQQPGTDQSKVKQEKYKEL